MPKKAERNLRATAKRRGYGEERTRRYVYGTLQRMRRRRKRKG
jgi:hypothetical protein